MSNNNNKLRKEVVLPASGSGVQTTVGTAANSDKTILKLRLSEIKLQVKSLTSESKAIEKQLTASKKKAATVSKSKKTTASKKGKK